MNQRTKSEQLELAFTEAEELDGEPTLPLGHVLETADQMAEHDEEI